MKLSTRSRYGLRSIVELAGAYGQSPLRIKTISERQDISDKYLEQLMTILKNAGLVRSIRGPKGGYVLARPPESIKLSEVVIPLEGPMLAIECLEHPEFCPRCADCTTRHIWQKIQKAILDVLESYTLQDLVNHTNGNELNDQMNVQEI